MKYIYHIILFLLSANICKSFGQQTVQIDTIIIDSSLSGDFSFTEKWDYLWPIQKDEENNRLINALNEEIALNSEDTIHYYYTSNCITNHQGEHEIRYCKAETSSDTLILTFSDCNAAYHGYMIIKINNNTCSSQWYFNSIISDKKYHISYTTKKQEIFLNTSSFVPGKTVKGKINIIFYESGYGKNSAWCGEYYLKGLFSTDIEKK